jgi:hypothetical protein
MKLTPAEKQKLISALKEISAAMTRQEAERDLIKAAKKELREEFEFKTKVLNRLAKTFHKQNFDEESEIHKEFEELYETVTAPSVAA